MLAAIDVHTLLVFEKLVWSKAVETSLILFSREAF